MILRLQVSIVYVKESERYEGGEVIVDSIALLSEKNYDRML